MTRKLLPILILPLIFGSSLAIADAKLDGYKASLERQLVEIEDATSESVERANETYHKMLSKVKHKVQQQGDLDKTTAIIAEIERFEADGTEVQERSKISGLAKVQRAFSAELEKVERSRIAQRRTLLKKYNIALEKLQKRRVQEGNIEAATLVKEERQQVDTELKLTQSTLSARAPYKRLMSHAVVHYDFENVVGKAVKDNSKNRIDGTIHGGAKKVKGKFGSGLEFDGQSYVGIDNSVWNKLPFNKNSFTISVWAYPTTSTERGIFCIHRAFARYQSFSMVMDNSRWLLRVSDYSPAHDLDVPPPFDENRWYHFVFVNDRKKNEIIAYVNGKQKSTKATDGSFASDVSGEPNIGRMNGWQWNNNAFEGVLDEVAIWNKALTKKDVKVLFEH